MSKQQKEGGKGRCLWNYIQRATVHSVTEFEILYEFHVLSWMKFKKVQISKAILFASKAKLRVFFEKKSLKR